jgi:hypothetical protein
MSFYLNGALADSAAMGNANLTNLQANLFRFGSGFFYGDPDFNGSINELRIWDGPLAGSQISTNYNLGPDTLPPKVVPRPIISSYTILPGQGLRLSGTGVPGQAYVLQTAGSLSTNISWTSMATNVVGSNSTFQLLDSNYPNQPRRFYRVYAP